MAQNKWRRMMQVEGMLDKMGIVHWMSLSNTPILWITLLYLTNCTILPQEICFRGSQCYKCCLLVSGWKAQCISNFTDGFQVHKTIWNFVKSLDVMPNLMVEDIGKINTLKFVHNQRNNKTPIVFKNYFIENRAIHQHNTRQTKDLHNTHANSNKKQQLIKRRGTKLWNQLPQSIRMPGGTLKTFTKHVKDRIISSYN